MLTHYLVLGLAPTASPKDVRKRYLELIRSHPPSQDPKRSPADRGGLRGAEGRPFTDGVVALRNLAIRRFRSGAERAA